MPGKRMTPIRVFNNYIPSIQNYQYEYYRPGCYYIPQVVRQVTPYNYTYFDHWQPYCNTATYVVDRFGRANYPSDLEYQLHVPTVIHHVQPAREMLYQLYDNGEAEISSLPQIEEDDFNDIEDVSERKRKRLNDEVCFRNEMPTKVLRKSNCEEFQNENIYRSNEGYLVEEPSDIV